MAAGKEVRGPLWVDGQFAVRVQGPGAGPGRIVRVRRPFALIGQVPNAEIRIVDAAVEGRHALLVLDRRGVFGVDLLSGTGTRFAGSARGSAWLGAGDVLEVAGRRVELLQLRVDGSEIDPQPPADDPLAVADPAGLVGLILEPLDSTGPPWMLGSALAFVGGGEACAIRVENASASRTHCALLRGPSAAHVIDLQGRRTLLNGRPVEGASMLLEGDVLTVGRARFAVRVEPPAPSTPAPGPREAMLALLRDAAEGPANREVLDALRQFQADAAALFEAQIGRVEALNREVAALREEIRGRQGPISGPATPIRFDLSPPPTSVPEESAAWLLGRLNALEAEGRSTWKDLLGRIASAVISRDAPTLGRSLSPIGPEPPPRDPR